MEKSIVDSREKVEKVTKERNDALKELKNVRSQYRKLLGVDEED